jgi:hypothetical protein
MIARIVVTALLVFAATSVATAQQRPLPLQPRAFPAEKFSTKPVQANPLSPPDPTPSEKAQKDRWDERSRIPSAPPR